MSSMGATAMVDQVIEATGGEAKVATVLERTVCVVLACHYLGNERVVDLDELEITKDGEEVETEKRNMTARKLLVGRHELAVCRDVQRAARACVRSMSVGTAGMRLFGPGTYLVPVQAVKQLHARLVTYRVQLATAAGELADRWEEIVEKRLAEPGVLVDRKDFATPQQVRKAFRLSWQYVRFGAPDRLEAVDKAAFEASQAEWNVALSRAYDDAVVGLRGAALKVMQELAERLRPNEKGERKALRDTALRDLNELLANLPVLNIGGDSPLAQALAPVGAMAAGLDVETLKKADGVRGLLLQAAERATSHLEALVVEGRRAIDLGGFRP